MWQVSGIRNYNQLRTCDTLMVRSPVSDWHKTIALTPDDQGRRRYSIKIPQ